MDDDRWETVPLQESSVYNDEENNESASSSKVCTYPVTCQQKLDEHAREWIRDTHARGHYSAANLKLSLSKTP